jgi:hypothetical protein
MSLLTRTDQKFLSFTLSSLCKPWVAGSIPAVSTIYGDVAQWESGGLLQKPGPTGDGFPSGGLEMARLAIFGELGFPLQSCYKIHATKMLQNDVPTPS